MGLLDKIKNVFNSSNDNVHHEEFEKVIGNTWKEYTAKNDYFWNANLNETSFWTDNVKNWPDKKKIEFIGWLVPAIHNYMHGKRSWSSNDKEQQRHIIRQAFLQALFR